MPLTNNPNASSLYYGWVITVTLAITETISWGIIYYAFTVFITPMEADLGWSRGELTGAFSLMLLVAGAMAFPVGAWVDKHGARLMMTIGSLMAGGLVIAWSQVTTLRGFYIIWAGLGVCAAMVLYEPAFAVIATWFTARRSTALAIVTFAAGLASTIFVPLSDALLNAVGWRDAVLLLGIGLLLTTVPLHAVFLRHRPHEPPAYTPNDTDAADNQSQTTSLSLEAALRQPFFWLLTVAFSLSYLSGSAIRVHFIPFLIDSGINASTAALASGAIGLMQVVGRVVFAPLDHRLTGYQLVTGIFALQAVGLGILVFSSSLVMVGGFIVIFGAAMGARTLARPSMVAGIYGTTHYGRISAVMSIFLTLAATVSPAGAGWLYDYFGNYDAVLWLILSLAMAATGVMLFHRWQGHTTSQT